MSMTGRIEYSMKNPEPGVGSLLTLFPLSLVYRAGVELRHCLYRKKIYNSFDLGCKVISVGNITVGGTGKTPLTIAIAAYLRDCGKRVVILTRGYKRKSRGIAVVSDGVKVLMGPVEAGDEPYLMARRLKGVPVVVGRDRVAAGAVAIEKFSPEYIILDDGFQHLRLKRDLNIVLMDAVTGFGNGYLLPMGVLREPKNGINRADVIILKGKGLTLLDSLALRKLGKPVYSFTFVPTGLQDLKGGELGLEAARGKTALAFAGLANPESFFSTLGDIGVKVIKKMTFPDHHAYRPQDMEKIRREAAGAELMVTTEKDGVKLAGLAEGLPLYTLSVDARLNRDMGMVLRPVIEEEEESGC